METVAINPSWNTGMDIIMVSIIFAAVMILMIISYWKLYQKAGEYGWAAIIPFYSSYVLYKIAWGSGWLFLIGFIPIVGFIFGIITSWKLAGVFGKGTGYAVGLVLLPVIFIPVLAFERAVYKKR